MIDLVQGTVVACHVSCPASGKGGPEPCGVRARARLFGREDPRAHGEGIFVLRHGDEVREGVLVDVWQAFLRGLLKVSRSPSKDERRPGKGAAVLPAAMHRGWCLRW